MAASDALTSTEILVVWKQDNFDADMANVDPDSDLSNGITAAPANFSSGTLVEPLPGGRLSPSATMIGQRAQTALQAQPRRKRGQMGGGGTFRTAALMGTAELSSTQAPNGGRLAHMLKAAWGAPMTAAQRVAVTAGASSTQFTVSGGHGLLKGMLISMNWNAATGGYHHEVRQIVAVSGNDITVNRALAGTPTASEFVHPLLTYRPAAEPVGHDVLYIKRRSKNLSPLEGVAIDFEGCAAMCGLVYDEVAGELRYEWTISANQWRPRTQEDLDLSSAVYTDTGPRLVLSRLYLGGSEVEAASVSVDPRITVAAQRATSGREGRSRWTHLSNPEGPVVTVAVRHDPDYWTGMRDETLYGVELHLGANSYGQTAATDYGYCAAFLPAAQIVAVEDTEENGLLYSQLTLEGVRSETAGQNDMYPLALGIAGRTA